MTDPKNKSGARSSNEPDNTDGEVDFTSDPLTDKIGSSLRRIYDDVVNEPVPDDFLALLAKADKSGSE